MHRILVAAGLVAALVVPTTATAAPFAPTLELATPTRLLFHTYSNGRGYFVQAPLTGNAPARRLFHEDDEPFSAVATRHQIIWLNEANELNNASILVASYSGANQHVLVPHLPNAADLVLAGPYVYWGDLRWVGRVRVDGTDLNRHFIRIPKEQGGGVEDGMTTDGAYLYFTQCIAGRIGKVAMTAASTTTTGIAWLAVDPHSGNFCPQGIAYSGRHLYYQDDAGIGRIRDDGSNRNDIWRTLPIADAPGDLVADSDYLYWDTCGGPDCAQAHIARMTTAGKHLQLGLYDHVDQGLTLAP